MKKSEMKDKPGASVKKEKTSTKDDKKSKKDNDKKSKEVEDIAEKLASSTQAIAREKLPRHKDRQEQRLVKSRRIVGDNASLSCAPIDENYTDIVSHIERVEKTRKGTQQLKLIAISHAECMPDVFPQWLRLAFCNGRYQPYDLNMPHMIRKRPHLHHRYDPPLTEIGVVNAHIYGRGLKDAKLEPYNVYCAPDMASVQTASALVSGMGNTFSMVYIEPALAPISNSMPTQMHHIWIAPEIYSEMGYHVAESYHPMLNHNNFPETETPQEFERRVAEFVGEASDTTDKVVLLVTHTTVIELIRKRKIGESTLTSKSISTPFDTVSIDIVGDKAVISENPPLAFTRIGVRSRLTTVFSQDMTQISRQISGMSMQHPQQIGK